MPGSRHQHKPRPSVNFNLDEGLYIEPLYIKRWSGMHFKKARSLNSFISRSREDGACLVIMHSWERIALTDFDEHFSTLTGKSYLIFAFNDNHSSSQNCLVLPWVDASLLYLMNSSRRPSIYFWLRCLIKSLLLSIRWCVFSQLPVWRDNLVPTVLFSAVGRHAVTTHCPTTGRSMFHLGFQLYLNYILRCIIQLGTAGTVSGFDIDTANFNGVPAILSLAINLCSFSVRQRGTRGICIRTLWYRTKGPPEWRSKSTRCQKFLHGNFLRCDNSGQKFYLE